KALALAARRGFRDGRGGPSEVDQPSACAGPGDAHRRKGLGGGAQAAAQSGDALARGEPLGRQYRADNRVCCSTLRRQLGERIWESRPRGKEFEHPCFIGVVLAELIPACLHTLNLFEGLEDEQNRVRLLE